MLTSSCRNCGQAKNPSNYADNFCPACTTLNNEAQQHFAVENPGSSLDAQLYAGRQAMQQRAIHPGSNYTDPRKFAASRGSFPVPPQSNS